MGQETRSKAQGRKKGGCLIWDSSFLFILCRAWCFCAELRYLRAILPPFLLAMCATHSLRHRRALRETYASFPTFRQRRI